MIFAAIRYTASLAADAVEALLFGFNHLSDRAVERLWADAGRARSGAERLTEKEAETEVAEPAAYGLPLDFQPRLGPHPSIAEKVDRNAFLGPHHDGERYIEREVQTWAGVVVGGGTNTEHGIKMPPDGTTDSVFRSSGHIKEYGPSPRISTAGPRRTDSDRLDHITTLLEDIRNLLQHQTSAAPAPSPPGPERAEGPRVAPLPSSPTERDTRPPKRSKWEFHG